MDKHVHTNEWTDMYIHRHVYTTETLSRKNPAVCCNMDRIEDILREYISHKKMKHSIITLMKESRCGVHRCIAEWWGPGTEGGGDHERLFNGYGVSDLQNARTLKMCVTTM